MSFFTEVVSEVGETAYARVRRHVTRVISPELPTRRQIYEEVEREFQALREQYPELSSMRAFYISLKYVAASPGTHGGRHPG